MEVVLKYPRAEKESVCESDYCNSAGCRYGRLVSRTVRSLPREDPRCSDKGDEECKYCVVEKENERFAVIAADTVVKECTVVVHLTHTSVTTTAVVCILWLL